ncbi:MAG: diguanylate cyclase [Eubacteriales bacterium]|nr:diguanylate cyclase [Eubacteriales bacterium]
MDQTSLSWLYYIVFTVYAAISSFMALRRPHSAKPNLLTLIFAAASVWALCFSFAIIAPDLDTSLLWRRLGVLGWGTIYSFILHLTLITTGHEKLFARRWIYGLLYLPAIINITLFLLVGESANHHFHLHFYRYGWINTWVSTFANWFHAVYYVAFISLSILLFLLWLFKTRDPAEKKQAKWFTLSLFAATFMGTLTDFINVRAYQVAPPQLGIVFVLFPAMVLFYLISKYGFLGTDTSSLKTDSGMLSGDIVQSKLFERAGYLIIFIGFFNLANRVLVMRDFSPYGFWVWGVLLSLFLALGGTAVIHSYRFGISGKAQRIILLITVLIGLASGIHIFLAGNDGTLWWLMLLIFIVAAVYGNPKILVLGVLAQIGIQFYTIIAGELTPAGERPISYVLRVIAIAAGVCFIYYVNRVYQARLRESREHTRMQNALLDLSRNLQARSGIPADNALADAMNIIAGFLGCHRAVMLMYQNGEIISTSFSSAAAETADDALLNELRAGYQRLLSGYAFSQPGQVCSLDVQEACKSTPAGRHMNRHGIEMIEFSPFLLKDEAMGILLAEYKSRRKPQDDSFRKFFHVASGDLSNFMLRALAEQELMILAYRDPLTGFLRREHCVAQIDERIKRHRPGELIAVLFIDLDDFKGVNDTAGHQVGNQVIARVGERFRSVTRPEDVLGRFGGDEFICLTTQTSREVIEDIAERLLYAFSEPVTTGGMSFMLSASIGIALYPGQAEDAESLLKEADIALYHVKASKNKGKFKFYNAQVEDIASSNIVL